MTLPYITAEQLASTLSHLDATRAIQEALRRGLDPAAGPARVTVPLRNGEFLLMPSETSGFAGVKVLSVAPGNPARGLKRIQGVYVLLDSETLAPLALLDGAALTSLRTPAVSAAAADALAAETIEHLVVFGSGPQALGHVAAMRAIRAIERVTLVARDPERAEVAARTVNARVGTTADVASAQLVVCATTARTPLFDSGLVRDDACLIAVGSHEADARELDSAIMARSLVVVEDRATALREAGEVAMPVEEGVLNPETLVSLRGLMADEHTVDFSRPRVFTSTGMPWEDLVIAAEVYRRS
ncbi:MAG: ornithine cyclodeaminase family protein [Cryobacterium sp.]|nr:ornithine cyclodeaminase family protein [Cryobacterium sp.]